MSRRFLVPVALASLLAAGWSCTGDATAPATASTMRAAPIATAAHRRDDHQPNGGNAAYVRCDLHPAYTGSADIGPRGGRLTVGLVTLVIPPGALSRTVRISGTMPAGENSFVEFQPSGLRFRRPAGLLFDAGSCDLPYQPDVLYVDDEGNVLERIETVYLRYLQLVAAPISHFSGYVLAW